METLGRLQDRVIVITGAARGLGKATAISAVKEGARVAVCDIDDAEGRLCTEFILKSAGSKKGMHPARYYHMDVTNEEQVRITFAKIRKDLGPIYGLVNNAGVFGTAKPLHELSEKEWDSVFSVTVKGVFLCTKHAILQMMEQRRGSIVNMSSIYGIVASNWDISPESYHASRAAVRLMSKVEAVTYAKFNIRVNSIHPGFADTRKFRAVVERAVKRTPLGRRGRPEEIASCIVFLLSDDSSFMTGSELVVDGGYTAI